MLSTRPQGPQNPPATVTGVLPGAEPLCDGTGPYSGRGDFASARKSEPFVYHWVIVKSLALLTESSPEGERVPLRGSDLSNEARDFTFTPTNRKVAFSKFAATWLLSLPEAANFKRANRELKSGVAVDLRVPLESMVWGGFGQLSPAHRS